MNIPRHIFLLAALVAAAGTVATAQEDLPSIQDKARISIGLKTGVNLSGAYNLTGEDLKTTPKAGFTTGIFLNAPLGRRLGLQPEVAYAQRGVRAKGTLSGASYDLIRTVNYIDVAVLLAVQATDMLSLLIGPQASFLTRKKDVFKSGTLPAQQDEFQQDNIRKKTVGIVAGPQFNLDPFVLDARIGWDFLNNTKPPHQTTPRYNYIWYQFTIGMRFN